MEYLCCEDCMMLQWGEMKTPDQDSVPFIVDKSMWRICAINSLAWYLIGGGPDSQKATNQEKSFILPNRAALKIFFIMFYHFSFSIIVQCITFCYSIVGQWCNYQADIKTTSFSLLRNNGNTERYFCGSFMMWTRLHYDEQEVRIPEPCRNSRWLATIWF